ncbi:MAG: hypothetical protein IJ348_07220 [Alistipes sp.]|nr:hypothetical protein [Alistipes sp.]
MRRFVTILIMALCVASATAQNVATQERVPRLKLHKWLDGYTPAESDYTYIGFIHSASVPCVESTMHILSVAEQVGMRVIIITKESPQYLGEWLHSLSRQGRAGVHHSSAEVFADYGIEYAPYGVITDKRRRALWFGNPNRLSRNQIVELIDNNKKSIKRCRSQK